MNAAPPVRAFVAIFPPADVAAAIGAALEPLRAAGDGIAWVRPANLHFTLRFLGPLDGPQLDAAARAVVAAARAPGVGPVRVRLGGPGAFPGPARARVLWLGAAAGTAELVGIAAAVEAALAGEKFARAERPFTPHLTVGRVREGAPEAVARFLASAFPAAEFDAGEIVLVGSTLAPGGSRYAPIVRAALGAGAAA